MSDKHKTPYEQDMSDMGKMLYIIGVIVVTMVMGIAIYLDPGMSL